MYKSTLLLASVLATAAPQFSADTLLQIGAAQAHSCPWSGQTAAQLTAEQPLVANPAGPAGGHTVPEPGVGQTVMLACELVAITSVAKASQRPKNEPGVDEFDPLEWDSGGPVGPIDTD